MFEIGNSLREARVRQGLEVPQVELATKIRSKYIRAIEDEQFAILPSDTYVKGFIRSYAEFLGLDGQLYVDEYATRYVVGEYDDDGPRRVTATVRPRRDHTVERRVVVFALVGIATVTALVFVAWKFGGGDATNGTPPVLRPATAPVELQLTGRGLGSYVEVRRTSASGRVVLEATVSRGRVERVAGTRFWLYVQHPQGVRVMLGGRPVSLPARRNLRVVVTPTKTSLADGSG